MSQLSFGITMNLSDVDTSKSSGNFDPLPAGWYTGIPEEITVNQKPFGLSAKVKFRITGPSHANRVVYDNLVLTHNTSAQAQDIGQKRLASWCDAIGVSRNLESMEPFLGREVRIRLRIDKPRTGPDGKEYDANNRIESFAAVTADEAAPVLRPSAPVRPAIASISAPVAAQQIANAAPRQRMPWEN